jgi:hypothetical protein
MKQLLPFSNEDLLLIKWRIGFFVLCGLIATGIFWSSEYINLQASRGLSVAQGELYSASSDVELIEEEEATIIEYIDRYQELTDQRIVNPEDRLLFLEKVAQLRAEFNLFPIALNIDEQLGLRLQYDPAETEPGGPIDLKTSSVSIALSLLHEEDLIRFLGAFLNSPGFYQARQCELSAINQAAQSYVFLAQHFRANCELLWYTFDLSPPA